MKRRVVIADDERMVRVAIRAALEPCAAAWEICGEAATGDEMIELVRTRRPDLALVDIRMPGTDGLAAVAACLRASPGTRYIVLSGVNDFERAREALSLGVGDYLLKPVRPAELARALDRAAQALAAQAAAEGDALTLSWRTLPAGSAVFEGLYLYLDAASGSEQRAAAARHLRLELTSACPVGSAVAVLEPHGGLCLLLRRDPDHPLAGAIADGMAERARTLLKAWTNDQFQPAGVRFGPLHDPAELAGLLARLEAERQARFILPADASADLQWLSDHAPPAGPRAFLEAFDQACAALEGGGREAALAALDALEAQAGQAAALPELAAERVARLARLRLGLPSGALPTAWAAMLRERLSTPAPAGGERGIVEELIALVERDYRLDIGLKQAAARFGLTPNYLSTVFRRATGQTFVSFLTARRIERAKALLRDPRVPLKDIAGLVGYSNRSYFDKVFAAATGLTPGEYRKSG